MRCTPDIADCGVPGRTATAAPDPPPWRAGPEHQAATAGTVHYERPAIDDKILSDWRAGSYSAAQGLRFRIAADALC